MSNLLSETSTNAFKETRLSSYRVLNRLIRFLKSIMNFAVRLMQVFFVTLLYFSAVKSAYIPKEGGQSAYDVVLFMDVYNKSRCQPREVLVEILQEYPDEVEHIFIPSCVVLNRCAGCCNDEMLECTPTITHNVTMEVKRIKPLRQQNDIFMSFTEHSECWCRPKKDVKEKREKKPRKGKGKGQKRKRKKNRDKPFHCEPCCQLCSERRRRWFVQDPETCQCSCKHSESDCKAKHLELNEKTCRCDKPRR